MYRFPHLTCKKLRKPAAFKQRHLHFRNPSGQWWGQFDEMDKFSFLVNFRTVHSTQYTVHSTQYTVHSTQYTVHSTQYTVHSTQYTVHSTQYTVHSTQYTVHSTQYTVHSTQYTVHSTQYTVHKQPDCQSQLPKTITCTDTQTPR